MGCNGSKSQDIATDRQRTQHRQATHPTNVPQSNIATNIGGNLGRSLPKGIAIERKDDGEVEPGVYGTSYTNKKTREYDLLHDIVKQTRHNFIDVSSKPGVIDDQDLAERGQKYVKQLSEATSTATSTITTSILELPIPHISITTYQQTSTSALSSTLQHTNKQEDIDINALVTILSATTINATELEWASNSAATIHAAIESICITDVGKVVLAFEEL